MRTNKSIVPFAVLLAFGAAAFLAQAADPTAIAANSIAGR